QELPKPASVLHLARLRHPQMNQPPAKPAIPKESFFLVDACARLSPRFFQEIPQSYGFNDAKNDFEKDIQAKTTVVMTGQN
ncbi:MAG: hypothetical protein PVG62_12550, partial [Desulfobacterales bacterium]